MARSIGNYRNLDVWKKAMDMADLTYDAVALFPKEELYGLTSQIKRAAISVFSNIAEGAARNSGREFIQFLGIAKGSLVELESQLLFAHRRGYIQEDALNTLLVMNDDIARMLYKLQISLEDKVRSA